MSLLFLHLHSWGNLEHSFQRVIILLSHTSYLALLSVSVTVQWFLEFYLIVFSVKLLSPRVSVYIYIYVYKKPDVYTVTILCMLFPNTLHCYWLFGCIFAGPWSQLWLFSGIQDQLSQPKSALILNHVMFFSSYNIQKYNVLSARNCFFLFSSELETIFI